MYQPSYVSINSEADEKNVSIWHVSPSETVSALCDVMFAEKLYFVYHCLIFRTGYRREYMSGTSRRHPSKALGEILSTFFLRLN